VVYVGVGMGSGICGLIAARDLLGLETEIVGVGSVKANATALSFAAGSRNRKRQRSLCRWIGNPRTQCTSHCIHMPRRVAVGGGIRGLDRQRDARYFDDAHQVTEGAGAAPLAALLQDAARMANKNVAVVLSEAISSAVDSAGN